MIDQYPSPNGVLTSLIWRKTMSGGETSLSGYDNSNQALSYTPGQEQVYLNGILLVRGDDYTATNGTSITGLSALSASDFIQVNCYNNFSVAAIPAASITGTITNAQLSNSTITINGTSTSLGGTYTNASASTSTAGIVQLTDSISSTSTSTAATPNSVKTAYDLANGAIQKTLTTTTGDIIYASSANTPARLGIGSTSQVLTVSGGIPAWATPVTGGMTLLSTTALSGTGVQINSIDQSYNHLFISLTEVDMINSVGYVRIRPNNLTTGFYGAGSYNQVDGGVQSLFTVGSNNTEIFSPMPYARANDGGSMNIAMTIYNYSSTTATKAARLTFGYRSTADTGNNARLNGGAMDGFYYTTSAITSLNVTLVGSPGSAVFSNPYGTNGNVKIYGVK